MSPVFASVFQMIYLKFLNIGFLPTFYWSKYWRLNISDLISAVGKCTDCVVVLCVSSSVPLFRLYYQNIFINKFFLGNHSLSLSQSARHRDAR